MESYTLSHHNNDGGTGSFVKATSKKVIKLLDPKDPTKVKAIHKLGTKNEQGSISPMKSSIDPSQKARP